MKELKELSDDELRLHELYNALDKFRDNLTQLKVQRTNADMGVTNLSLLIKTAKKDIAELESTGTKRPEVKEPESVTPATQPINK